MQDLKHAGSDLCHMSDAAATSGCGEWVYVLTVMLMVQCTRWIVLLAEKKGCSSCIRHASWRRLCGCCNDLEQPARMLQ